MKVILTKGSEMNNEDTIAVPLGFSWICFFFGFWVPLLREEWRWFLVMSSPKTIGVLILKIGMGMGLFTLNILVLLYILAMWALFDLFIYFKYNELNLMAKLKSGYRPIDSRATNLIKRRYPKIAYRFHLVKEA